MDDRLERLLEELRAIGRFDDEYRQKKFHDESDDLSYQARQERRREIMRAMTSLSTPPKTK
jgi:uncharacterized protein (UPF0128 family)